MRRSFLAAGLALGALAVGAAAFYLQMGRRSPPPPIEVAALDAGIEDWCADGLTAITGGGCLAAPYGLARPAPLLVYLHGRYSPKTLADEHERQRRVARLGNAKGYAVLAMRGVQGECTQPELADTWCWPSNPRNADHGATFFERFKPAMREAHARVGQGPTVLLGFSNGAYFASLLATRGLGPFDAIAIAHGGPVQPTHAVGSTPPLLLITADDDPSDGEMQELHSELTRERWAHEIVGREGGHALPDWDVTTALTFFGRVRTERLPLVPPLQAPRVRPPRASDADAESAAPSEPNPYDDAN